MHHFPQPKDKAADRQTGGHQKGTGHGTWAHWDDTGSSSTPVGATGIILSRAGLNREFRGTQ